MMKFYAKKGKIPLLYRKLLRNPSKRIKTSTPQLDREGLVPPFQAPFKEKTPVFDLHALHQCIENRHFSHMRQETNRCEGLKRQ